MLTAIPPTQTRRITAIRDYIKKPTFVGKSVFGCRTTTRHSGDPGRDRTPNPLLRRQVLYPVELRDHSDGNF